MHQDCKHDLVFDRLMRDDHFRKDRKNILKTLNDGAPSQFQTDDIDWPNDPQFNRAKLEKIVNSQGKFNLTEYLKRPKSRPKDVFVRLKHDRTEHNRKSPLLENASEVFKERLARTMKTVKLREDVFGDK